MRTRIKICGLTREEDVIAAVEAGADAIGFVFYPKSPRYLTPQRAAELVRLLPPFVTAVGLFVNETPEVINATLATVPLGLLQFIGDEDEAACRRYGRPYVRVVRVPVGDGTAAETVGADLVQCALAFPSAQGLLLDTYVDGYGGAGKTFDWALIPARLARPIVLAGGLDAGNVGTAIRQVRPSGVDVSSGVEGERKGIKDAAKIRAFIAAVRAADALIDSNG